MNLHSYITRNGPTGPSFPRLMEGSDFVVLFHAHGKGTVIASHGAIYDIGHYSEDWAMDTFRPFSGNVTIGDPASVTAAQRPMRSEGESNYGKVGANAEAKGIFQGFGQFSEQAAFPESSFVGSPFFEDKTGQFATSGASDIPCGTPGCCAANPLPESEEDDTMTPGEVKAIAEALGIKVEVIRVG